MSSCLSKLTYYSHWKMYTYSAGKQSGNSVLYKTIIMNEVIACTGTQLSNSVVQSHHGCYLLYSTITVVPATSSSEFV